MEATGALSSGPKPLAPGWNVTGIPFFNGGLFREPATLAIGEAPLRAITKAAEANWTFVDPHIFGSVFQGIMDDDERHASSAHYTAREDIMSVVGPTIVEPWRERIAAARTLKELKESISALGNYRVLDPACGSGNFLYVAFRELYKLETEALCRVYEFASAKKGKTKVGWASSIRATNFFGIDINPFAVELAKTTLNFAKKIAFEERRATVVEMFGQGFLEIDPSLPLDNLDENIVCADALFCEWPTTHAIIGNPPFLNGGSISSTLGSQYRLRIAERFDGVHGRADYCSYWFRRAHCVLPPGGRAGLIGTSSIREGHTREASTDFICARGGTITSAVSSKEWPGAAVVHVSVVNWIKGEAKGPFVLFVGGRAHRRPVIEPHLQLYVGVSDAARLTANRYGTTQGIVLGTKRFLIDRMTALHVASTDVGSLHLRPVATGMELPPGYAWYAATSDKTHTRLEANPEEWAHYHTMYQELRKSWDVVPFEEEIRWLEKREGLDVGDFGCGEALIAASVSERHRVRSFDHVAVNETVHACDISAVPLDAEGLDVAVFCLALMGANFTDYIREAHRCLRLDGELHIWEPASYFDDQAQFCADLGRLGFDVLAPRKEGLFLRIRALKNATAPAPGLSLIFRGHSQSQDKT